MIVKNKSQGKADTASRLTVEQRLDLARAELARLRDVVGEIDAELIDAVLEDTANNSNEGRKSAPERTA